MKNYEVYFEIFGKRMKTTVLAENAEQAKTKVKDKLVFHKVELKKGDIFNSSMDAMDMFHKIFKVKK